MASLAIGLTLFRAVDPVETDPFSVLVVQDFDRIAVEVRRHLAGEVARKTTGSRTAVPKGEHGATLIQKKEDGRSCVWKSSHGTERV